LDRARFHRITSVEKLKCDLAIEKSSQHSQLSHEGRFERAALLIAQIIKTAHPTA
jgi:hypothetical protein